MLGLWAKLLADDEDRRAAFALDAILVEGIFLVGPALTAGLLLLTSPGAVLLVVASLSAAGTLAFASSPASRSWQPDGPAAPLRRPLASAGIRTILLATFLFGIADGILQVVAPAYAVRHHAPALAGVLLAARSLGSVVGGVLYGMRSWPSRSPVRLLVLQGLFATGLALAAFTEGPALIAGLAVTGMLIAPMAAENSLMVDAAAPPGTITEAFAWLITAVIIGGGVGTALAGALVEAAGARSAMLSAAATLALAVAAIRAGLGVLQQADEARHLAEVNPVAQNSNEPNNRAC